ncbi:hypothetical protein NC653_033724 [Populus alba x Populus x berolinensis]|uniref:RIN4 pathogenic type III effector avirulence factor Avr cleavage site domain-containing protein n=1 Tax=Populus alba x Populus x berolinensis TaxID=444605 RepID=A0AAD6LUI3_9ROSI|nr:hypothetical protein NC653_033724 [Populus alba x Populus x berolinensis]
MAEKDQPLPKFGEWDVNDPASAEGFTVIFNKARNEKKTGGQPDSPTKDSSSTYKPGAANTLGKPQTDEIPEKSLQRFGAIMNPRVRRLCVVDRVPCPCFIIADEKMLVMVETQKMEKK